MRFIRIVVLMLVLPLSMHSFAVDTARGVLLGQGSVYYFFMRIYDVSLYTPSGVFSFEKPFTLSIDYAMDVNSKDIVDASVRSIKKLGFKDQQKLHDWAGQMASIFPDVAADDNVTGVVAADLTTAFYFNDDYIGGIADKDFTRYFFGIWLDERTQNAALRASLMGRVNAAN